MTGKLENILVLKLGGIGDVITAVPALRALRRTYPAAHIALAAERPGLELLEPGPLVDRYLDYTELYRCQDPFRLASARILRQAVDLCRSLRRRDWDAFVCLQSLWRRSAALKPRLLARWSGAPIRAGLDTSGHGAFLTHGVPDERFERRHYVDRFLDVVRLLGCEAADRRTEVWLRPEDRRRAGELLREAGVEEDQPLAGIHPGSNPEYIVPRSWPPERFAAVADGLTARRGGRILLTGGEGDAEACRAVRAAMKHPEACLDLSGRTSVRELAACIERCHLFVSNDTGPMHVAVALGVPTVGVFGPSDWQAYGTYPPDLSFRMVRSEVDCWPCEDVECPHRRCLTNICAEDVLDACRELLSAR